MLFDTGEWVDGGHVQDDKRDKLMKIKVQHKFSLQQNQL